MSLANISRIKHGDQVFAASPGRTLYLGDVVMVVGTPEELEKMQFLLGKDSPPSAWMSTRTRRAAGRGRDR